MKKWLSLMLVGMLFLGEDTTILASEEVIYANESEELVSGTYEVIAEVGAINQNQQGKVQYQQDESGIVGPNSFWIDEEENVYVLDAISRKIISIEDQVKEINIANSYSARDIIYHNNKYYIYDMFVEDALHIYDSIGELLFSQNVPLEEGEYVNQLIERENVRVTTFGGQDYYVNGNDEWTKSVSLEVNIPKQDVKYKYVRYIDTDKYGNVYTANIKVVPGVSTMAGEISICRTSPDGKYLGEYIINGSDFVYLPDTYVRVTENGCVYIMVPQEERIEIRKVELTNAPVSNMEEIAERVHLAEMEVLNTASLQTAAQEVEEVTLTRQEVLNRANLIAGYQWYMTEENVDLTGLTNVDLPQYIDDIALENAENESWRVQMSGIPYCWGGFFSQYSGNESGMTFDDAIEAGYAAGNMTTEGNHVPGTAGLDCSGYVSAAYGFSKKLGTKSTDDWIGFMTYGRKVELLEEMQTMDYFVKNGHVILFYTILDDSYVLVCETALETQKTKVWKRSLDWLFVKYNYQMRTPW